jgi:hypothetical protein
MAALTVAVAGMIKAGRQPGKGCVTVAALAAVMVVDAVTGAAVVQAAVVHPGAAPGNSAVAVGAASGIMAPGRVLIVTRITVIGSLIVDKNRGLPGSYRVAATAQAGVVEYGLFLTVTALAVVVA